MNIQTVSTKQLRENFSQVIKAMEEGESLLLLYRSKPLAEIKPVKSQKSRIRKFSYRQIQQWVKDDKLTDAQQKQIDSIIKRLP
ncbi:type II toxin-antitoxin system Phd/YefM family antitoxin [Candidatus Gottesmanbacteria bacterium]|nr:type II toxin-antitoxin system Phd/YefM family antitoxin [Candidatus Gottesmanbacteria bacterium]